MVLFANVELPRRRRPRLRREGGAAARGRHQGRRDGPEDLQGPRPARSRKADGTRLKLDDPELDPIWAACARLNIPVLIHTAEPQEFFEPLDYTNERWLELALYPDRRYPPEQFPRFEELMAERDRMFAKHPKTTFILAHFGWHANDLARLGKLLDRHAERLHRGRRDPLRPRPPAARGARLLRQVPGPDAVRQGQLPARRVSVLLARRSRPPTSTSTTTATTTRSGSCTAWACPTRC